MFRVLVLSALFALPSVAGAALPAVRWHCAYAPAQGEYILCQLLEAPPEGPPPAALPASYSRLPRIVGDIRNAPQSLDGTPVAIPLFAPPIDMALAARLARNVMCGPAAGCDVDFHAEREGLVQADRVGKRPPRR